MVSTDKKSKSTAPSRGPPAVVPALMPSSISLMEDLGPVLPLLAGKHNEGKIHALNLQPKAILLLSIFSFYCKDFVGVRPSLALLHHIYNFPFTVVDQHFACISFVDVKGENICLNIGKKVEGYRQRSVFMDACWVCPRLTIPEAPPAESPGWSHETLDDPRAKPVPRWIALHRVAHLTGAMIIKGFLGQRIVPL
ncbi:hypothetical protein D1007_14036 [Hordeum vulgare]|nr:hypothetical protein D1007_14036 [Hordeum vulgare]